MSLVNYIENRKTFLLFRKNDRLVLKYHDTNHIQFVIIKTFDYDSSGKLGLVVDIIGQKESMFILPDDSNLNIENFGP